jgi:hypothetical protein
VINSRVLLTKVVDTIVVHVPPTTEALGDVRLKMASVQQWVGRVFAAHNGQRSASNNNAPCGVSILPTTSTRSYAQHLW